MATTSGKTSKAKPSQKSTKAGAKPAPKGKGKPKPQGDGEGTAKFNS
jgi:hypothetical protein